MSEALSWAATIGLVLGVWMISGLAVSLLVGQILRPRTTAAQRAEDLAQARAVCEMAAKE